MSNRSSHPNDPRHTAVSNTKSPPPELSSTPSANIEVTRNQLTHWHLAESWIFVTWRLGDSLPHDRLRQWTEEQASWLAQHPKPWDEATRGSYHELFTQRFEDWLDAGYGCCVLRQPEVRQIVADALQFFAGQRYELGDWVIMPNHVHVLFRSLGEHRLPDIIQSWKSFTAKKINGILGRSGRLWQEDYWDRLIRSQDHFNAIQRYIQENPIKARLRDDDWSGSFEQTKGAGASGPESA